MEIGNLLNTTHAGSYLGPACLKEKTFTVIYDYILHTPIYVTGNYSVEYNNTEGKPLNINGRITSTSYHEFPYLSTYIKYSNISVSPLGKVDVTHATYTSGWSWQPLNFLLPYYPFYTRVTGSKDANIGGMIANQYKEIVGRAGPGNPHAELVDRFIRDLLHNTDFNIYSGSENYLESVGKTMGLEPIEAPSVETKLERERTRRAFESTFKRDDAYNAELRANGCFYAGDEPDL